MSKNKRLSEETIGWLIGVLFILIFIGFIVFLSMRDKKPEPVKHFREPSAICRDGSFSYSSSRQGTCSHHGGVAEWK